ncbi:MAG: hypothetical protein HDR33_00870 [Treponema sp.]|nr:hypothetical protein [Treponema sp.]
MKSIKKFLFIMVALATALAFVSCSNGSDDGSNDSSIIATYGSTVDNKVLVFIQDGNNTGTWSVTGYEHGNKITYSHGRYNGHPETNGVFEVSCIEYYDDYYETMKPTEDTGWEDIKVEDGMLRFDYSWDWDYIDFKRQ